jgi:NAD(P)-dependent dehydrogenase (short-subunit alcohol dehydrogenase family)
MSMAVMTTTLFASDTAWLRMASKVMSKGAVVNQATRFEGKVAIVTGGGSGIGAAIARRFAREGASVVVADIDKDQADHLAAELREDHDVRVTGSAVDVRDEEAIRAMVDMAVVEFGGLDIMVNNAGIGESSLPIDEKAAEGWHQVLETNLTSVFYGIKHAARVMKGSRRGGVIINMASILGVVGFKGAPAYCAAKHGMLGLTKAAALELAADRIRVVAVSPAFIRTPLISGLEEAVLPLHPMGRLGESEEVADLTAFLASDEAAFITGTNYLIDGGYTVQ